MVVCTRPAVTLLKPWSNCRFIRDNHNYYIFHLYVIGGSCERLGSTKSRHDLYQYFNHSSHFIVLCGSYYAPHLNGRKRLHTFIVSFLSFFFTFLHPIVYYGYTNAYNAATRNNLSF